MKKLIALIICTIMMLLCSTSCTKANAPFLTNGKDEEKLSFFQFLNLEWGMSFEDICRALDRKESDFELSLDKKSPTELPIIHKEYNIKLDVFEEDILTIFIFKSVPLSDYLGLVGVDIIYADMTAEKFNATLEKVKKNIEYQDIKYDEVKTYDDSFKVKSQSNYNDFSQKAKEKFNKYNIWLCEKVISNGDEPPIPEGYDYKAFDFFGQAMTGQAEITSFSFSFEKKQSTVANMYISGDTYQYIMGYCNAYDKLNIDELR